MSLEHPNITLVTHFTGELLNMGILDSGCTQSVCGCVWLKVFRESLADEVNSALVMKESSRTFKFGDGEIVRSLGTVRIPIGLQGVRCRVWLETDVIDKDLPLLISRSAMKKADTKIEFNVKGRDRVTMLTYLCHLCCVLLRCNRAITSCNHPRETRSLVHCARRGWSCCLQWCNPE